MLRLIDGAFDLIFWPFRNSDPMYGLIVVSFLTGLAAVLVFGYVSNQESLRRIKNRIQAHLLELRLFPDQLGVVLKAYGRVLRWTLSYLMYNLKPLAILMLPLVIIMVQLDLRLGCTPLQAHQSFILTAKLAGPGTLDSDSLKLPKGLTLTAPPVNIPALNEVDWRIRADENGVFTPSVVVRGQSYAKQVVVSKEITPLASERGRAGIMEWFMNPVEQSLPRGGPLRSLEVNYAPRSIDLGFFVTNWLVVFLVVSLVSGFALKMVLGIEI
ncbi:MAG: hypothetical protein ABSH52_20595 [Terriglobia bacterium]